MDSYKDFSTDDLLHDDFFRRWVIDADEQTNLAWQRFLIRNPDKQTDISKARAILLAIRDIDPDPSVEVGARMWSNIQDGIEQTQEAQNRGEHNIIYILFRRWGYAAAILLVGMCVWWIYSVSNRHLMPVTYEKQVARGSDKLTEYHNSTGSVLKKYLPDGSSITLQPGAKVSFEKNFGEQDRRVYLSGKGYFEVEKNEQKPFLVFADNVVTRVVGTKFTVSNPTGDENISVAVKSGLVRVFTSDQYEDGQVESNGILLKANEQANYLGEKKQLLKVLAAKPEIIKPSAKYPDFDFKKASVHDVFTALEDSYGVSIEYDLNAVANCNLTAELGDLPLFKKLDIICRTIGATYAVWGTRIIITTNGCPTNQ